MDSTENTVFVGEKDIPAYVMAVQTQAVSYSEILLKARGRYMSKAIDISQIVVHKVLPGWEVVNIKIGTESNQETRMSYIYITLQCKDTVRSAE